MKTMYFIGSLLYCFIVAFFLSVRLPELSGIMTNNVIGGFTVLLAISGCLSLFIFPAKSYWYMVRRFALITLVRITEFNLIVFRFNNLKLTYSCRYLP